MLGVQVVLVVMKRTNLPDRARTPDLGRDVRTRRRLRTVTGQLQHLLQQHAHSLPPQPQQHLQGVQPLTQDDAQASQSQVYKELQPLAMFHRQERTGSDKEEAVARDHNLKRLVEGIQAANLEANSLVKGKGMAANAATSVVGGLSDRLFGQGGSPSRVDPGGKFGMPQFGPPGDQQAQETLSADESSPLNILVQGMRQLQQVYMEKKGGADHEALKSTELPALPELTGDTGVEFSDWLYVAEQTIAAMSDSASLWYEKTLACVREAYSRYQVASPLERLTIGPRIAPELLEPKWVRLDRKVMTLILAAMPKTVREDAVTHRVSSVAAVLFRLHILYSPGGIAERTAVLKHLEGHSAGDQVVDAIAALRRWKRHLTRSQEMLLSVPDASIPSAWVGSHRGSLEAAFLGEKLQSRPTQESVMKFYDHLMAELQQALPAKWSLKGSSGTSDPPKVRAIGAGMGEASETTSPTGSPTRASPRSTAATTPCKFFASDAGCKRGQACKFQHEFQGKDDKRARPAPTVAAVQPVEPKATVPAAPVKDSLGTSVIGSGVGGEQRQGVVVAEPIGLNAEGGAQGPEIQAFMKEVNTMLQRLTRLSSMKVVDSLEPEIKRVEASMAGFASAQDGVALLDSGATHPFKPLVEKDLADIVQVQLADGQKVDLQQNRAGTLMPVKNSNLDRANSVTTIVPLGTLVQEFGLHGGLGQARFLGLETKTTFEAGLLEYRRIGN
ncbi:unnamed protein product, partial [Symbiodinium microadriaticum]